jgi:precorrin-2 dehydrogenase/sirohydrochlorin ferrochelatase
LRFLPVGLSLRGRGCLVVGGGSVATRKVISLIRAGATVTVVSPALSPELTDLARGGRLRWLEQTFQKTHLAGAFLVVAATNDEALNATIARQATEAGSLACDASSAERSHVIFGALLDVEDATVAVFTDGRDPAHARYLRDRIGNAMKDSCRPPEAES